MLDPDEKAYMQALQALRDKQYGPAVGHFDRAAEVFGNNREFSLLRETTRLLLEVKRTIAAAEGRNDDVLTIEETLSYGKETELHGQGAEEEVRDLLPDLPPGASTD
jgi:hypothetical protein